MCPSTRIHCDLCMTGICGFQLRLELRSAVHGLRLLLRTNISHHPTSEEGRSGPWSERCRGNVTWSRCWAGGRSYRWQQAVSYRDECSSDNDRSYRLLHNLLGSRIDCPRDPVTDGLHRPSHTVININIVQFESTPPPMRPAVFWHFLRNGWEF